MVTRASLSVGSSGGSFPSNYTAAINQSQADYGAILKGYEDREAQSDVYGKNQTEQANQYYGQVAARTDQNALSRGLANTTIRSNMAMGVNRQRDQAFQAIGNDTAQRRLGISQDRLGFMERYGNTQMQWALQQQQLANQMDQYNRTLAFQESRTPPWNVARTVTGGGGGGGYAHQPQTPMMSFGSGGSMLNMPPPGTLVPTAPGSIGGFTSAPPPGGGYAAGPTTHPFHSSNDYGNVEGPDQGTGENGPAPDDYSWMNDYLGDLGYA